jgi:hypothetical protein
MNTNFPSKSVTSNFRMASIGLVFALMTILFGQILGVVFGLNEDAIKDRLSASAIEVLDSAYNGHKEAIKPVLDKSWNYMQRAHLHAGAMGTTALVLIIFVCLIGTTRFITIAISIGLGAGGFGYSVFWMWAGFRAPGLGSTGAAKESLKLLAMPSSGAFVLATVGVLCLLIFTFIQRQPIEILNKE